MPPDLLAPYNAKRDFTKTREPAGELAKGKGNAFLVQKHDATRLHYDLRLEMDGVLKSWAVTKGPSPDPGDKRLAVRTEDHPTSYGDFEGSIPKGEYGGGTVMLWDRGTWAPVEGKIDLAKGKLHFIVHGERMKGEWLLVRMAGKAKEKRENWLLRKIEDEYAGGSDDLVGRAVTSVKTGRSMSAIAADEGGIVSLEGKSGQAFDKAMKGVRNHSAAKDQPKAKKKTKPRETSKLPEFRKPQLATLADAVPAGNNWLHEIKYDGYRCLLAVAGDKSKIYTRSGLDWTAKFQDVADAAGALGLSSALIDGEIVKAGKTGNPDFSALQKALKEGRGGFTLFAFDLLEEGGEDLTTLSTVERKERLAALIPEDARTIRCADHLIGAGETLYRAMCEAGQEGIISKRADAPYRHKRTRNWLKIKCTRRQEFVIIGWRKSSKKGRPFASVLLAQNENGRLVYKGRAGTGFTEQSMEELAAKFQRLSRKTPPADVPKPDSRDANWLTPTLVAEIAFAEFTADDRVRHGSFIGLRSDKKAEEVVPEAALPAEEMKTEESLVKISSRSRVIFPDAQATKGDLADYYQALAPIMLPWLAHRPVSLVRCPQGRAKKCFFQRHDAGSFGEHVKAVPITEKDGGTEDYLYVEDTAGILACVQMGTIEFHGWGSRIEPLEQPDRMAFDLDPDEALDFADVKMAAQDIRGHLADIGLVSFAMLSGGKGVHVVVPLTPEAEWPEVKDFSSRFARALAQSKPDRFTATMSKEKRKGKIFIDWLRNQRGATSVAPYSARSRSCAPVAAPISWEEIDNFNEGGHFRIRDLDLLLERSNSSDLKRWGTALQVLPDI